MRYQITGIAEYGYTLVLNPMTSNIEAYHPFGPFPTMDAVRTFYEAEKVEPYQDEGPDFFGDGKKIYSKTFRKGGPLEMMNALSADIINWSSEEGFCGHHGHGVHLKLLSVDYVQRQYKID